MALPSRSQKTKDSKLRRGVEKKAPAIRQKLLKWFRTEARSFRWRTTTDSYVILISEMLLKKTTAPVVDKFLPEFLLRYPDLRSLARAQKRTLRSLLKPLGLSEQRASQLLALAKILRTDHSYQIPTNPEMLLSLPGVGEYTANSVLCVAFGRAKPVVDTNVARILMRLFGFEPSRFEARRSPEVWLIAEAIVGSKCSVTKRMNWAMLDLGALICKARVPSCPNCPLRTLCCFALTSEAQGAKWHGIDKI